LEKERPNPQLWPHGCYAELFQADVLPPRLAAIDQKGPLEVWAKPLADGGVAVGLFNRGESENPVTVRFKDVGAQSTVKIRDLWTHKDLGSYSDTYTATIPRHGAVLIKMQF
jgi:alpha-galactosidase